MGSGVCTVCFATEFTGIYTDRPENKYTRRIIQLPKTYTNYGPNGAIRRQAIIICFQGRRKFMVKVKVNNSLQQTMKVHLGNKGVALRAL
jgi:hypothetical protein